MADYSITRRRLSSLLSSSGFFASVPRIRTVDGDPLIHCHTCLPGPAVGDLGTAGAYTQCGGAGFTENSSWVAAAGEGIERYCAIDFSLHADYLYGPWDNWREQAPRPESWCLFSREQYETPGFRYRPFEPRVLTRWYTGVNLSTGASSLLPGPMICFPYRRGKKEDRLTPATTTGLAFSFNREQACCTALWEVIERDAIVLAWHWRQEVKRIDPGTDLLVELTERVCLDQRYTVDAYDITSDLGIPTCMVFIRVRHETQRHLLAVGAACRGSLPDALEKAFLEAVQGVPYVRHLCDELAALGKEFSSIGSFKHSAAFYSLHPDVLAEYLAKYGDFLNAPLTVGADNSGEGQRFGLRETVSALQRAGYTPYYVEMSNTHVQEAAGVVVRVVVPGLYGLEGNYRYRWLDPSRARRAATLSGNPTRVNHFPHPLP